MEVSSNTAGKHPSISRRQGTFVYRRKRKSRFPVATLLCLALFTVFITSIDRIVCLFVPETDTTSIISDQLDASNPPQLIKNAFQLGHELTQMRYADTNYHEFTKWKNRSFVNLVALGIDTSVLDEAIDDVRLTLEEAIVIRDQVRDKLKNLYGEKAASTFIVGAELIPVTRAFELLLKDDKDSNDLEKNKTSKLQFGSLLKENYDAAVFPDKLKMDLTAIFSKALSKDTTWVEIERIKKFREEILKFFYETQEDHNSSDTLTFSSVKLSPFIRDNNQLLDFYKDSFYNYGSYK